MAKETSASKDIQELTVDFANEGQRRDWLNRCTRFAQACQFGVYRFTMVRMRARRTDRQNRFYWPCFVEPFAQWLTNEWGYVVKPLEAHEILKAEFLTTEKIIKTTGIVVRIVGSTTTLTTTAFNEYLENVADFLVKNCDFIPSDPKTYRESDPPKKENGHGGDDMPNSTSKN